MSHYHEVLACGNGSFHASGIAQWRLRNPGVRLDLSGVSFTGFLFEDVDMRNADVTNATFQGMDMTTSTVDLEKWIALDLERDGTYRRKIPSDLKDTFGLDIWRRGMKGADLHDAILHKCIFNCHTFRNVNLTGANLCDAYTAGVRFRINRSPSNFTYRPNYTPPTLWEALRKIL